MKKRWLIVENYKMSYQTRMLWQRNCTLLLNLLGFNLGGPPPPGFVHPVQPQPSYQQTTVYQTVSPNQYYGNTGQTVVLTSVPTTSPVVVLGGCPSCRVRIISRDNENSNKYVILCIDIFLYEWLQVGILQDSFTCAGIFLCILFFPLGIIFLLCNLLFSLFFIYIYILIFDQIVQA